jgi:CrcB protein
VILPSRRAWLPRREPGRYLLDQVVQHRRDSSLHWGTMQINVTGSFAFGPVTGLAIHHGLPATTVAVIGIGLLGGYTTCGTFTWEPFALAQSGAILEATVHVSVSLVLGPAAAAAGLCIAVV